MQRRVADHMFGSNFNALMVQQHLPHLQMKDLVLKMDSVRMVMVNTCIIISCVTIRTLLNFTKFVIGLLH